MPPDSDGIGSENYAKLDDQNSKLHGVYMYSLDYSDMNRQPCGCTFLEDLYCMVHVCICNFGKTNLLGHHFNIEGEIGGRHCLMLLEHDAAIDFFISPLDHKDFT